MSEPTSEQIKQAYSLLLNKAIDINLSQYDIFQFERIALGNITLSSGAVVARDPLMAGYHQAAFTESFPIGHFPTFVCMAAFPQSYNDKDVIERRIAFAYIEFKHSVPVDWSVAMIQPAQNISPFEDDTSCFSYDSDSTFGAFMDQKTSQQLDILLKKQKNKLFNQLLYSESTNQSRDYAHVSLASLDYDGDLAFFSTGYGAGSYISYIGKDSSDSICYLITDFEIIQPDLPPC